MRTISHRSPQRLAAALAAALALAAGLTAGATAASADDTEETVPHLHYTMEGVGDGTVPDVSGNGLDGTLAGEASVIGTDDGGSALNLAGGPDGGHVSLPRGALEGATDLTVSARVRWDGEGGAWQRVFDLGSSTERSLFSTPSNHEGNLRTAVTTRGGGGEAQVTGHGPLRAGEWATLTTTLDTAAGRITTYLNGVAVASAPTAISAGELLDAGAERAGWIGRSFYPDPLLDGAVTDFRVYHAALGAEEVAALVDEVPTAAGPVDDTYGLRTLVGAAPDLPRTVRATFSDGYDRDVPVVWDDVDPERYATPGTYTVRGQAAGATVTAEVTVTRGELRVDLGSDTGAFHGGASGTLYGLYGPGLPSDNLIEGMSLRTVSTKAQDGPQHPGADALEVVRPLADATDGDVYIYMTDIHRGFPYQWPGETPQEKIDTFIGKMAVQVDQVLTLPEEYQDNVVFVPFNEPEGNMFGTGEWSYDRTSWLDDPADYFAAWDRAYRTITERMPDARIAGPNTSILYPQVKGFLEHAVEAGTVPQVITWHELSHPQKIRDSVATYREWEADVFAGTSYEGTELPININEYAFNYHTSVPGQMIQWVSAIEDAKVDADIAYWNIDGNLSDSAVEANRGNGQWWLLNAYGQMTGHTVEVTPPFPGENYTLQGVATLDAERAVARTILGGADGAAPVDLVNVPRDVFGDEVRVFVREIPWTGQLGDSAQPRHVAELTLPVSDGGTVSVEFDGGTLPLLRESSAYEVVVTPAGAGTSSSATPALWEGSYEAEDAAHTGSGYSRNGPEGSPSDVGKFYTSGGYDVGGLRTGSDVVLDFEVDVPADGTYDLSVFANSLNTDGLVAEQGPTNVFVRVDGHAEQELHLPLGYKWVVWDHADTTVDLTAGTHTISLAARSLDGSGTTVGDAIVDRITLALPNPDATTSVYEAELANHDGRALYDADAIARAAERARPERHGRSGEAGPGGPGGPGGPRRPGAEASVSGSGAVGLGAGETATFWVYGAVDGEATLGVDLVGSGSGVVAVNGHQVLSLAGSRAAAVHLRGGVNKITVTGRARGLVLDRITVGPGEGRLDVVEHSAEDAALAGTVVVEERSLADGGAAVAGIGGVPGNENTLRFDVTVPEDGTYAMVVRYSNPEQSEASHYNPDPLARRADISVNEGPVRQALFPHTFHANAFAELTVDVELVAGHNTVVFASSEAPNFDGETFASDTWPGILLRSSQAPVVDTIRVSPLSRVLPPAGGHR